MIFAGEGAWRWKMLMPSADRSYEFFWRQVLRWLTVAAPEPVEVTVPEASEPGDAVTLGVDVRDASFTPVFDATVNAVITSAGGETQALPVEREVNNSRTGHARFTAAFRPEHPGLDRKSTRLNSSHT